VIFLSDEPTYKDLKKRVQELEHAELVRKRTEEELAQIFSMSLDMLCIADMSSATFLKVNSAFTEILGYSEEELLEIPFLDLVHPDDIDATRNVLEQKLQSGGKAINFENRYQCKDRSYRWLSWVSHPNPEEGKTYAVARDITEWKKNDEALKRSKALLDATGRMARVGGWELNVETMEVIWTEETYRIHEIPPESKIHMQEAINFYHPEDRPKLEQAIQRSIDYGEPYDMELRLITAKGNHLWTHSICEPEVTGGKTTMLKGTFQDITDLKLVDKKLRESEEKYRQFFHSIKDSVIVADIDRNIIDCNQTFRAWFGYTKKEILGRKTACIYESEEAFLKMGKKFKNYRDLGEKQFTYTINYRRKSGDIFPGETNALYLENDKGETIGFIGIIKDITYRRKVEKSLLKANDELERKTVELEDTNTALKVLLQKRDQDNLELQENIYSNYELLITPFLSKLKNRTNNRNQQNLLEIIETNLQEIVAPFAKNLSNPMMSLTSSEIQIATMIKQGYSNKEIATILNSSKRTIDTHRQNIRRKLKLNNEKINLKTYLINLQKT